MRGKITKLILGISICLTVFYFLSKPKEVNYSKPITHFNDIQNISRNQYWEDLVRISLDELKIEGITVKIIPMESFIQIYYLMTKNMILKAFVVQESPTVYSVYIAPTSNKESIRLTISHEIIHIHQYVVGTLKKVSDDESSIRLWKGHQYDIDEIDYEDIPWEIDARSRSYTLSYVLKKRYDFFKNISE